MLCKGIQNPNLDYGSSKYVDHFSVHLQKDPIWFVSGHVGQEERKLRLFCSSCQCANIVLSPTPGCAHTDLSRTGWVVQYGLCRAGFAREYTCTAH